MPRDSTPSPPPVAGAGAELFAVVRGQACPPPAAMVEAALRAGRLVNAMRRVARQWPRTRPISLQVARYLTTLIPETNGQPVLYRALAGAVQHTLACILAHPGRALDAESLRTFVIQLCRPLPAVLQCTVRIPSRQQTWNPLADDLYDWLPARERVVIYRRHAPVERAQLTGLFESLLPRLLTPADLWAMHLTPAELLALVLTAADASGADLHPLTPRGRDAARGATT